MRLARGTPTARGSSQLSPEIGRRRQILERRLHPGILGHHDIVGGHRQPQPDADRQAVDPGDEGDGQCVQAAQHRMIERLGAAERRDRRFALGQRLAVHHQIIAGAKGAAFAGEQHRAAVAARLGDLGQCGGKRLRHLVAHRIQPVGIVQGDDRQRPFERQPHMGKVDGLDISGRHGAILERCGSGEGAYSIRPACWFALRQNSPPTMPSISSSATSDTRTNSI
nr:hypothetical protein [Sphingopyxis sp. PET50]